MNIVVLLRQSNAHYCSVFKSLFFKNLYNSGIKFKNGNQTFRRNLYRAKMPFDDITSLPKDTILYSYDRGKFFRYLGWFGVVQLCCWTFMGVTMYKDLKDVSDQGIESDILMKHPIWRRLNLGESKYRITAFLSCLTIGIGTAIAALALPSRTITHLILCKGGTNVIITTFGVFGRLKTIGVPLCRINCKTARADTKAYISLKIQGKFLYYLLDTRGKFFNPELFDYTIGTSIVRKW